MFLSCERASALGWPQAVSGCERSDVQACGVPGRAALWGPEARGRAVTADGSDGCAEWTTALSPGIRGSSGRLTKTELGCLSGEVGLNLRMAGTPGDISKWNSTVQIACREAVCGWGLLGPKHRGVLPRAGLG